MILQGIWTIHYNIFSRLTDRRLKRNREHLLADILLIAIAPVLSGAESWNDIEEYGGIKAGVLANISHFAWRYLVA